MADQNVDTYSAANFFSNIFEPYVVLPSQFLETSDGSMKGGERKLMAALLSDGIEAYISVCATGGSVDEEKNDIIEWVHTKDYSYVFSFDVVCECLGINPDYLRLGLSRYLHAIKQAKRDGVQPNRVWKKIRRPRKR